MTGFNLNCASVRLCHRCLCVLAIRFGKSGRGVMLGFHRGQARPREFLCLQVLFCAGDGRLGGIEIRRCRGRRACRSSRRDGLPGVAHFLHGSTGASDEADDTDQHGNEAQHRDHGH
jgi:hypothetical protein